MDWPYELQIGWRYTRAGRSGRRNRFISFISAASMAGIALGVAALIIVLSVMNGFRKEVRDRMLSVVSHVEVGAAGGEALADWRAVAERVRRHPQVAALAPFVAAEALVARGDEMRGIVVRGIFPAEEAGVTELAAGAKDVLARLAPGERQRRPRRRARQGAARQGGRQGQPGPAGRRTERRRRGAAPGHAHRRRHLRRRPLRVRQRPGAGPSRRRDPAVPARPARTACACA